jgi:hypothetical protein
MTIILHTAQSLTCSNSKDLEKQKRMNKQEGSGTDIVLDLNQERF